jgi:hypothetical protein
MVDVRGCKMHRNNRSDFSYTTLWVCLHPDPNNHLNVIFHLMRRDKCFAHEFCSWKLWAKCRLKVISNPAIGEEELWPESYHFDEVSFNLHPNYHMISAHFRSISFLVLDHIQWDEQKCAQLSSSIFQHNLGNTDPYDALKLPKIVMFSNLTTLQVILLYFPHKRLSSSYAQMLVYNYRVCFRTACCYSELHCKILACNSLLQRLKHIHQSCTYSTIKERRGGHYRWNPRTHTPVSSFTFRTAPADKSSPCIS